MSESNKKKRLFNFGRVFFPGDKTKIIPDEIRFQPLGNHVGNVTKLAKNWKLEDFPTDTPQESRKRVIKGSNRHDIGKPQRFSLQTNTNKKKDKIPKCQQCQKYHKYKYSFSSHRFLAEFSENIWVQTLARGHHDYSVRDITRDTYELKKISEYRDILEKEPLAYAKELYILEMCDQIEAELACKICDDSCHGEERTFMEYSLQLERIDLVDDKEINIYSLEPYPFEQLEIQLEFTYWSWKSSDLLDSGKSKLEQKLQKIFDDKKYEALGKELDSLVKKWWKDLDSNPKITTKQVTIKPNVRWAMPTLPNHNQHDCKYWYRELAGFISNPMQEEVFNKITSEEHPACIVKAPTGKGKLEAILFPSLIKNFRLILPLPAKSLLQDHQHRIEKYFKRFSQLYPQREFSLVIDTGSEMKRYVYRNGEKQKSKVSNPRRHLYKGDVILTTLDKFIYRYFAFGDANKNFVFPLRINGKIDNRETLICFDEAHSYENLAFTNFKSLIDSLYEAGRSLVLMTATMPKELVQQFDYLADDIIDYVDNSENVIKLNLTQNDRSFNWLNDITRDSDKPEGFQAKFTNIILEQWQARPNSRIITVVETVQDAVAIYQNVKKQLKINNNSNDNYLFLYHGRLDEHLRPDLYQKLKDRDSNDREYILITTSAIEVGCDLNSEILISQICPPENLIQRVGRCNRNGKVKDAKVILIGDHIPEYINTLDESGWDKYQQTLKQLTTFETDKILDCIYRQQHIDDYRAVELFSMLHDYVYDANLTYEPTHRKGLIPTRSWTPSVTLVYDDGTKGNDINKMPKITVGIDRVIIKKDKSNIYAGVNVYERYYDSNIYEWKTQNLSWGLAYQKNILVKINKANSEIITGEDAKEYIYNLELGFVDLPGVFTALSSKETENRLLYQIGEHKAIIHYVKPLTDSKN